MTAAGVPIDTPFVFCAFLVLLLPLLSFILALCVPARYVRFINVQAPLLLLFSALCAAWMLWMGWNNEPAVIEISWLRMGDQAISANMALSNTSLLMLTVVSCISFLVHVYSTAYMAGDNGLRKYFAMLGFFTFSMQGIVLADNLLMLFIFWELVGFSSYILIGHWTEKPAAGAASKKAFIMNRIGDAGFLVGLMIVWAHTGSFDITGMVAAGETYSWQTAASLCIFCGVMGKSAQFPLFTWLPDAMEGPTPVSALIHAATMVAAGVYLLVRIFVFFTPASLTVVACTGMVTALAGALAALFQYDIKKVLAYSTMSQLGLMIMAIGLGIVNAALLHLFTHAFFKACLFLSAGAVIHALHRAQHHQHYSHFDIQDIRNMGGLRKSLPLTFFTFLLGGASLAGIPFFSGFLSKEAMLAAVWLNNSALSWVMLVTMVGVSFITVLYTFRLLWYIFMGTARKPMPGPVVEPPLAMRGTVLVLALCSLWLVVSWNPFDSTGWLLPQGYYTHVLGITVFSVIWILAALAIGYRIFNTAQFNGNKFLENGFYIDLLYRKTFGGIVLSAATVASYIDKKWIDGFIHRTAYAHVTAAHITGWFDRAIVDGLVNGLASTARGIGSFTRSFQGGKIQVYIFWAILAIIIFLIWTLK